MQEFLKIESVELIIQLEKILDKEIVIAYSDQFSAIFIEEFNNRIEASTKGPDDRRIVSARDLKVNMKKWTQKSIGQNLPKTN